MTICPLLCLSFLMSHFIFAPKMCNSNDNKKRDRKLPLRDKARAHEKREREREKCWHAAAAKNGSDVECWSTLNRRLEKSCSCVVLLVVVVIVCSPGNDRKKSKISPSKFTTFVDLLVIWYDFAYLVSMACQHMYASHSMGIRMRAITNSVGSLCILLDTTHKHHFLCV